MTTAAPSGPPATAGALQRVIQRAAARRQPREPRCELCGAVAGERHRHLLDTSQGTLLCACHPCTVLFRQEGASEGRYLLVPDRRARIAGFSPAGLGVPVGLAFFVPEADGVMAHYPSPARATRWEVDPAAWRAAARGHPLLGELAPRVEALLVNTARGRSEAWVVPIDDCYRLVAIVRRHWRGMYGGDTVWEEIERFFGGLRPG